MHFVCTLIHMLYILNNVSSSTTDGVVILMRFKEEEETPDPKTHQVKLAVKKNL